MMTKWMKILSGLPLMFAPLALAAGPEAGCEPADPAWSPAGDWLALVANCGDNLELYLSRPDGSEMKRLTNTEGEEHTPAWAPDGRSIAFTYRGEAPGAELRIRRLEGRDTRTVLKNGYDLASPTWSPDGTRIAYESRRNNNTDVYVLSVADGRESRLTEAPGRDSYPTWAPDGSAVAFQTERSGRYEIHAVDPDGDGEPLPLVRIADGVAASPAWSPDGRRLAFACMIAGEPTTRICSAGADGSGVAPLTRPDMPAYAPAWGSEDRIAYMARHPEGWRLEVLTIGVGSRVLPLGGPPGAGLTATLDSLAQAEFQARPIAGLLVAVVRGQDTLLFESYGSADLEHDVPMDPEAVFQIASVTKQFTAAAVLLLVERRMVDLDDDIRTHLPDLETYGHVVRVREMLNHTSGIPNIYEMTSWPRIRPLRLLRPEARALELAGVAEDSLDFQPGSRFHYSNTAYDFLGDMIEEVTGRDVESFFRRELFEPAGMQHTDFCPWTRILPGRAWGYEPDSTNTYLENARRQAQGILFTSGGICSTVRDLLRWNDALHDGRILSETSYRAMTTPEGGASTYGYGLWTSPLEDHPRIRHNGSTPGFSAQLEYYPEDDLSIVVLSNSPSAVQTLAEAMARAVLRLSPHQPGA